MTVANSQTTEGRSALGCLGNLIAVLITVYGIALILMVIAETALPTTTPWVGIIESLLQLALIPSPFILLLAALLRRTRLALLMLPGVVAFLILYGGFLIPRSGSAPADAVELRLLTYNIQVPADAAAIESVLSIIRSADADMVAIQELNPRAAEAFEAELSDLYPHQTLYPRDQGHSGQGFLSQFEIVEENYWQNNGGQPDLGHLRVVVNVEGQNVTVYNTHPIPPFSLNRVQPVAHSQALRELLERANAESGPMLLMGDFNMTDRFDDYARITDRFTDAFRAVGTVGFGFTFPAGRQLPLPPVLRLDYVFYDSQFTGIEARVWPESGSSDHHPLFARVALLDAQEDV